MKCQFCQAPCYLLREGNKEYRGGQMIWECREHGNFWVRHHVYVRKRHKRGSYDIQGTYREWHHTTVSWLKGKGSNGIVYRAYYYRENDRDSADWEGGEPGYFRVTIETAQSRAKNKKNWNHPKESTAIEMDEWPNWTIQQLPSKVATFIVFS